MQLNFAADGYSQESVNLGTPEAKKEDLDGMNKRSAQYETRFVDNDTTEEDARAFDNRCREGIRN